MTTTGTVRLWHDDEGWGVIDSEDTPGGCWAGFASVLVPGYASLAPGQAVTMQYVAEDQDGYAFRATEVWPLGQQPYRTVTEPSDVGYSSSLTIRFHR